MIYWDLMHLKTGVGGELPPSSRCCSFVGTGGLIRAGTSLVLATDHNEGGLPFCVPAGFLGL